MVDYSRWDRIEVSSDECDREPQISKFDEPQSITFGGTSKILEVHPTNEAPNKLSPLSSIPLTKEIQPHCPNESSTQTNGLNFHVITRNGSFTNRYFWSQCKDTVTIHFIVDLDVKGKDITLKFPPSTLSLSQTHDDDDRMTSWPIPLDQQISQEFHLTIHHHSINSQTTFINERFPYPIKIDEDYISWELRSFTNIYNSPLTSSYPIRCLIISLIKSPPLAGTTVWWNRLFESESPVNVDTFPDRPQSQQSFKEVWDEAHRQFTTKMAQRTETGEDHRVSL